MRVTRVGLAPSVSDTLQDLSPVKAAFGTALYQNLIPSKAGFILCAFERGARVTSPSRSSKLSDWLPARHEISPRSGIPYLYSIPWSTEEKYDCTRFFHRWGVGRASRTQKETRTVAYRLTCLPPSSGLFCSSYLGALAHFGS
jgi:hypothetical protein